MSEPTPPERQPDNHSEAIRADFNTHAIGNISLMITHHHGMGNVEITADESTLISFQAPTPKTLMIELLGAEAQDFAAALEAVAAYIRRNTFTA